MVLKDEDKWPVIHAYRHAVSNDLAPAITCPDCRYELLPTADKNGDPAFRCLSCLSVFNIGLDVYDQMIRNLKDVRSELQQKFE